MKIERKYMAHYLNAAFGSGDASYTRLGSDLEEYSPELTANVEKSRISSVRRRLRSTATRSRARSAPTTPSRATRCLSVCRPLSTAIWCWMT